MELTKIYVATVFLGATAFMAVAGYNLVTRQPSAFMHMGSDE